MPLEVAWEGGGEGDEEGEDGEEMHLAFSDWMVGGID